MNQLIAKCCRLAISLFLVQSCYNAGFAQENISSPEESQVQEKSLFGGRRGPRGHKGPRGPRGRDGATGPQGQQGIPGPTGPGGSGSGITGPTGPTGPAGADGVAGATGATGATGTSGGTFNEYLSVTASNTQYSLVTNQGGAFALSFSGPSSNVINSGITFDGNLAFTVPSTGVYLISYYINRIEVQPNVAWPATGKALDIELRKYISAGGYIAIPYASTTVAVESFITNPAVANTYETTPITFSCLVSLDSADKLAIWLKTNITGGWSVLESSGSSTYPSVSFTICRVN